MPVSLANSGENSGKEELFPRRCSTTNTAWRYTEWHLIELLLCTISVQKESLLRKLFGDQGARCRGKVFFYQCRLTAESEFGAL